MYVVINMVRLRLVKYNSDHFICNYYTPIGAKFIVRYNPLPIIPTTVLRTTAIFTLYFTPLCAWAIVPTTNHCPLPCNSTHYTHRCPLPWNSACPRPTTVLYRRIVPLPTTAHHCPLPCNIMPTSSNIQHCTLQTTAILPSLTTTHPCYLHTTVHYPPLPSSRHCPLPTPAIVTSLSTTHPCHLHTTVH